MSGENKNSVTDYSQKSGVEKTRECLLTFKVDPNPKMVNTDSRPKVILNSEKHKVQALIDSGAQISLISNNIASMLNLNIEKTDLSVSGIGGAAKAQGKVVFLIKKLVEIEAYVVDGLKDHIILGIEEICKLNLLKYITPGTNISIKTECKAGEMITLEDQGGIDVGFRNLSEESLEKVNKVIDEYPDIFMGHNDRPCLEIEHAIELTSDFSHVKNLSGVVVQKIMKLSTKK